MSGLQLGLLLVATVWAGTHLLVMGHRSLNGTRDRVLTGRTDEGVPITPEHRRLLLDSDWRMLGAGLAALCLLLFATLVTLPELTEEPGPLRLLCYGAAGVVLSVLLVGGTMRRRDRILMKRALDGRAAHGSERDSARIDGATPPAGSRR